MPLAMPAQQPDLGSAGRSESGKGRHWLTLPNRLIVPQRPQRAEPTQALIARPITRLARAGYRERVRYLALNFSGSAFEVRQDSPHSFSSSWRALLPLLASHMTPSSSNRHIHNALQNPLGAAEQIR